MMKLDNFVDMMTGHFNNKEQFDKLKKEGKAYPYAEHINIICNEKILNLPKDFNGKFVVEESYYETNGKRHASPHLFLITEKEDGIWEGGSISQFSPIMTFKLWEKFSDSCLEVSESMEVNGKKTFGYDEPIIYKRV